ncbi:MAG: family 78 glycoside hydrolase catalytic domain [Bacteroidales bacterium]|nr:family 78 glycoside hydrolase catalytic domain [Bacteroidales bacterium]
MRYSLGLLVFVSLLLVSCGNKVIITNLTVEMQDGSMPLATAEPRFSWNYEARVDNVMQVDYHIVVASSEEKARKGLGDLWDTTAVSNQMLYVPYKGKPLKSRDQCWWKVFTTVTYGEHNRKKALESEVHHFEISLLSPDDWKAHWIGRDYEDDILEGHTAVAARYLRKDFPLDKKFIERARLYISGLGVYTVYINGSEVAPDEMMKPTLSDYTQRIYFNAYDVTDLLHHSDLNTVGVILEGGRFTTVRHDTNYLEWCGINHAAHYGRPQLLMQLEVFYKDGTSDTFVSDNSWKITNRGPIRKSNEFDGETYDARLDLGKWTMPYYDDSEWNDVVVDYDCQNMFSEDIYNPRHRVAREYPVKTGSPLPADYQRPDPMRLLTPQPNPNIKVRQRMKPIAIFPKDGKWILDMGQNMVGVLECGKAVMSKCVGGDTITFRYAESLNADSTLYTDNLRSAECTDSYIAAGSADVWSPMFTYHGFRYVEITGLRGQPKADDFTGLVLYDEMPTTGTFETSNPVINAVYRNATWGIRGNYRSMPTDCPQRDERMGWTGDRTTGCYGESFIFNNHRLYAKWLQDLADSQFDNGALPDVAPAYWRNYTDNITWPGAFITVADMLFTRFGDIEPIRKHYDAMKRWMLHMKKYYLKDGILIRDTYGDWCVPPESPELIHTRDTNRMTWPANLSTPYYAYLCKIMQGFAIWLDKDKDAELFQLEYDTVTVAYNNKYLDTATGNYANGTVTANILPLAFDMVPGQYTDKVFGNIINKTMRDFGGHISTGVVGIQQLMRTLTDYGRGDLALRLATDTTYPSWGYMATHGATTIWELWNGDTGDPAMNSGNHVMLLGDLITWYYEYLGGILPLDPGYQNFRLAPTFVEGLDRVDCTYRSVCGMIESHWVRKGGRIEWTVVVPPNTTAEVYLPSGENYDIKTVGSGRHKFTVEL